MKRIPFEQGSARQTNRHGEFPMALFLPAEDGAGSFIKNKLSRRASARGGGRREGGRQEAGRRELLVEVGACRENGEADANDDDEEEEKERIARIEGNGGEKVVEEAEVRRRRSHGTKDERQEHPLEPVLPLRWSPRRAQESRTQDAARCESQRVRAVRKV